MQARDGRRFGSLHFAIACALLVAGGAFVFREAMGTHRLPIHITSVIFAVIYAVVMKSRDGEGGLQLLGLNRPRFSKWVWVLMVAGVLSGILRYEFYRYSGLGGVELYDREFVPFLQGDSVGECAGRFCVFFVCLYAAVIVPGVLFFAVIQEPFSRVGWFPVGLLLQSSVFGLVHCYMTGAFDPVYGVEASLGAALAGIAFDLGKNVYVPALFLSLSVFVSTFLLAVAPG